MSRKQRILKKRYAIFCEGDTEYNYTDKMRKKQGVELVLKPINMHGGGYSNFLCQSKKESQTNYSNILESLSRDIHCYCVQVNSSDYGDSRITKPSKTEDKDIMRTKGGINSTILVDEIDVSQIRDFQLKEYNLQAYDKKFKPTPPGFKPDVVMKKIKGEWLGM